MKHQIQNLAKEPDHQLRVRQILGECQMSGGAVTYRNDMALGLIIETLKTDGGTQALEVAKQLTELHPNFADMLTRVYAITKHEYGS